MTREAAREGFERYLDRAAALTREEFSAAAALRGRRGPAGRVVDGLLSKSDRLERRVVRPQLDRHRGRVADQIEAVLDYAADPRGDHREALLAADPYRDALDPGLSATRRAEVSEALVERARDLGDAVAPLVASPESEFWSAVRDTHDREAAMDLVENCVDIVGPLREHRDAFAFRAEIDPADVLGPAGWGLPGITVEYTDEAARAMGRAQEAVIREAKREVRQRYDG